MVLLGIWNNAPGILFMADKPVRSIEDLRGLKIRVPSRNSGLVVEAWGATPVSMPAPEIYNAMQTGVVDGAMIDATTNIDRIPARRSDELHHHGHGNSHFRISFLVMNRGQLQRSDRGSAGGRSDRGPRSPFLVRANAAWLALD